MSPRQVVDLGLDGVYPTLQVWSDGLVRWLCSDGNTWYEHRAAGLDQAMEHAARLSPLVVAALDSRAVLTEAEG